MPSTAASTSDGPTVPLSFSNNFWGRDDAGVGPLLERLQNAKSTCDELKAFYNARAALEDEYARKLLALSRKPLGSGETGTLRVSFDVLRGEVENTGKSHATISQQMKSELEEPLAAFAGGMKERRKIVQAGIERLLKTKQAQTMHVNKARARYEQDCLRIKGYLAQGHMVMGQEERKNKAKLEKTQINMASDSNDYEAAVKVLEETTGRWNKEWKAACDKFQDLEEERLDFTKSSLWSFANIASTVCVSDDASCEKIRLALENCEVEKDITSFIKERGTGQEIPDPPRYINYCRGDMTDTASEASEDDSYSIAQFPRTVNPAFRSASPNPSTYESHHDPHSQLAQEMGHGGHPQEPIPNDEDTTPSKTNSGRPPPLNYRPQGQNVPPNYSPSQHGDVTNVPHNEYPTEGMTMFCRTGPPSVTGSGVSSNTRPSSRDSQSEYSNPTSYTSADPVSGKTSPTKAVPPVNGVQMPGSGNASPEKGLQKKRSGFFSNSPFRRKSKKEVDQAAHAPSTDRSHRNTWAPQSALRTNNPASTTTSSTNSSPIKTFGRNNIFNRNQALPDGEEQADPRATFQLNVGNNVFDVASPDSQVTPKGRKGFPASNLVGEDMATDPLKQALMELQQGGSGLGKQSSTRVTADRYHGIKTPAPDAAVTRPAPLSAASADKLVAERGTPPPAYEGSKGGTAPALGVPQPAFTSKEMKQRTEKWGQGSNGTHATYTPVRCPQGSGPRTKDNGTQRSRSPAGIGSIPRVASPQPFRSRSPGPDMVQSNANVRARSPGPDMIRSNANVRARSPGPDMIRSNANVRARSPAPDMIRGNANIRARSPGPDMIRGNANVRARSPGPDMIRSNANVRARSPGPDMIRSNANVRARSPGPAMPTNMRASPGQDMMRSGSPGPVVNVNMRAKSPGPTIIRSRSPRPAVNAPGPNPTVRARSPAPARNPHLRGRSPAPPTVNSQGQYRAASPKPYRDGRNGQSGQNSGGMEMQLSSQDVQRYDAGGSGRTVHSMVDRGGRPGSAYGVDPYAQVQGGRGMDLQMRGEMSNSVAPVVGMVGKPILHYARAMYSYSAAIPEELSFSKGDILAIYRLQDDGWWEAQIVKGRQGVGTVGLVPSNYLLQF